MSSNNSHNSHHNNTHNGDKRPSRLFGSRISSIFALNTNSSQDHLSPQTLNNNNINSGTHNNINSNKNVNNTNKSSSNTNKSSSNTVSNHNDSNRSLRLKSSTSTLRLSKGGPFSNYLHNRSNASIDLKSSLFFFDGNKSQNGSFNNEHQNHLPQQSNQKSHHHNKDNVPLQASKSPKLEQRKHSHVEDPNSVPSTPKGLARSPSPQTLKDQEYRRLHQHDMSLKSPTRTPGRKPPPSMLDPPNSNPKKELEKLPSMSKLPQTSMSKSNRAVHDELNDIIGTLEDEIGNMTNFANHDVLDKSGTESEVAFENLDSKNLISNTLESSQTSPLPDPQTFLFNSPTKSIAYSSDLIDPVRIVRSQGSLSTYDYNSDYSALDLPPHHAFDLDDHNLSDTSLHAPYPIDSPVVPSPVSQTFKNDITLDNIDSTDSSRLREGPITNETSLNNSRITSNEESSNHFNAVPPSLPSNIQLEKSKASLGSASSLIYSQTETPNDSLMFGSTNSLPSFRKNVMQELAMQTDKSSGSLKSKNSTFANGSTSKMVSATNSVTQNRAPIKPLESTMTTDSFPRSISTSSRPSSGHTHHHSSNHHRNSSSISSLFSSSSSKNVNLATLKKTLNLQPGEGERSNYVLTIRRNVGTAYNDSGPGKWKLPTGIQPIDRNASTYLSSNGRFMRLTGNHAQQRSKKVSGVELKHGHLAPRLLAAEVNDFDDLGGRPKMSSTSNLNSPKGNVSSNNNSSNLNGSNEFKSSNSSILGGNTSTGISRENSLARTATMGSVATGTDSQSILTGRESSTSTHFSKRTSSISTSSSGSLSDSNVEIGGYYQHPGYRYDDENGDNEENASDSNDESKLDSASQLNKNNTLHELTNNNHFDEDEDKPKLTLANPDYSSDSD